MPNNLSAKPDKIQDKAQGRFIGTSRGRSIIVDSLLEAIAIEYRITVYEIECIEYDLSYHILGLKILETRRGAQILHRMAHACGVERISLYRKLL